MAINLNQLSDQKVSDLVALAEKIGVKNFSRSKKRASFLIF